MAGADVVVIGAGIVGACCALALADRGAEVIVVERGALAGGSTAAGEGNILVSDKEGPELDLGLHSARAWRELGERVQREVGADIELEPKGGIVVAATEAGWPALRRFAAAQREAGAEAVELRPDDARAREPELTPDLCGAVWYPQDQQVQPVLAVAAVLRLARQAGAQVRLGAEVIAVERDSRGAVRAVASGGERLEASTVVNAAGAGSPEVAALAGAELPILPRRGHVLVTAPTAVRVRHKVYDADYVGTLDGGAGGPQVSSVVESTQSGTVLIGSSREFVGFDRQPSVPVMAAIARRAVRLFPRMESVPVIRAYVGFRPWSPDRLPIIGADPRVPGLVHATGHEGAGIGLAPATGELVAALVCGEDPPVDPAPFDPGRASLRGAAAERAS